MPDLRLEIVTTEEGLRSLSREWCALLERSRQNEPTLAPPWVTAWWRVFSGLGGRALRVCAVRDDERLVALAPLLAIRRRHQRLIPLRRLECLCSGEPRVDEILSEYLGVVVESGLETPAAEVLSAAVTAGRLGEIDAILLPSLNGDDPMPRALRDAFRSAGWVADLTTTGESPFVPLPATWEAYLEKLPSRRRHKVRRAEADLLAWSGQPLRLRVVQSEADLSEGRAILERLHEGRWRTAGQRGVFGSQRFAAFHDIVLPVLLANGALEMAWLEARGEAVAAQYNIVWGTKVYFYQGGRRTDIPRHLRPGFALHAIAIRRAIELGRSEYDFLGGPSAYKLDLALATRSLTTLHARRPGPRLAACRALDRVTGIVRRLRRREGRPANSAPLPAAGPVG